MAATNNKINIYLLVLEYVKYKIVRKIFFLTHDFITKQIKYMGIVAAKRAYYKNFQYKQWIMC